MLPGLPGPRGLWYPMDMAQGAGDIKTIVRSFYEDVHNKRNINALDLLLSYTWVGHDPWIAAGASHFDDHKLAAAELEASFPDLHVTVDDMMVDGDKVAARTSMKGTHRGVEFKGVKPTGKKILITGMAIHRVTGGKIAESWMVWDLMSLMTQLGAIRK